MSFVFFSAFSAEIDAVISLLSYILAQCLETLRMNEVRSLRSELSSDSRPELPAGGRLRLSRV